MIIAENVSKSGITTIYTALWREIKSGLAGELGSGHEERSVMAGKGLKIAQAGHKWEINIINGG